MRLLSWNVNSLRVREARLLAVLARHRPDVVCLQETKMLADAFPTATLREAGYHSAVVGQKTYNGVALLAREPLEAVAWGLSGAADGDGAPDAALAQGPDGTPDRQARFVMATVYGARIASVYVPNGSAMDSPKSAYKLRWLARLRAHLLASHRRAEPLVLAGDFNVAPRPCDVARPEAWEDSVLCHPQMRAALAAVCDWGLQDVFAKHHPVGGVYSWWDYRQLGFAKGNGLRIDLALATDALACRSTGAQVDRDERRGSQPSDHAPVLVDFAWP